MQQWKRIAVLCLFIGALSISGTWAGNFLPAAPMPDLVGSSWYVIQAKGNFLNNSVGVKATNAKLVFLSVDGRNIRCRLCMQSPSRIIDLVGFEDESYNLTLVGRNVLFDGKLCVDPKWNDKGQLLGYDYYISAVIRCTDVQGFVTNLHFEQCPSSDNCVFTCP